MVSVCTVPARGGRSCEHFGGYKTINRIPLNTFTHLPGFQSLFRFLYNFELAKLAPSSIRVKKAQQ